MSTNLNNFLGENTDFRIVPNVEGDNEIISPTNNEDTKEFLQNSSFRRSLLSQERDEMFTKIIKEAFDMKIKQYEKDKK